MRNRAQTEKRRKMSSSDDDHNGTYKGFDYAELKAAFDRVSDKADWKAPINARVKINADHAREMNLIEAAIVFYTATTTFWHWDEAGKEWIVSADGYRRGPCGDH